ncbi:hypothetical protein LINGRAHAP2_LOCUS27687 [Linum grandiflorum]
MQVYKSLHTSLNEAKDGLEDVFDVVRCQMGLVMTIQTRLQSISNLGTKQLSSFEPPPITQPKTPDFDLSDKVHQFFSCVPFYLLHEVYKMAVACYVFLEESSDEIIVDRFGFACDRQALQTLRHDTCLSDQVITAVSAQVALQEFGGQTKKCWYLPAEFQRYVLVEGWSAKDILQKYQYNFLVNAYRCRKIYMPMRDDDCHWYLVIVRIEEGTVQMVDPLPEPKRMDARMNLIKRMLSFLSQLIYEFSLIYDADSVLPNFTNFVIEIPKGVQTVTNMNDCGL